MKLVCSSICPDLDRIIRASATGNHGSQANGHGDESPGLVALFGSHCARPAYQRRRASGQSSDPAAYQLVLQTLQQEYPAAAMTGDPLALAGAVALIGRIGLGGYRNNRAKSDGRLSLCGTHIGVHGFAKSLILQGSMLFRACCWDRK
jgi:hypothetical protein